MREILVTGGTGYIGSHTVLALKRSGYQPVIVDNFRNSSPVVLDRLEMIAGSKFPFHEADLRDQAKLDAVFKEHALEAVIHFAGLKAVGESVEKSLDYYQNNLVSTLNLCAAMRSHDVRQLVFSSSATVYGSPSSVPIDENAPLRPTNPYGQTKVMIEQILKDFTASWPSLNVSCLRYFNPIGAHDTGLIGEAPNNLPNNLLPYIAQVSTGKLKKLSVFGSDYDTPDGTGVRDYIHVSDLALGHIAALQHMPRGWEAYNLGTGRGYSVLEIIQAFEAASGRQVPYEVISRRPGDIGTCYADTSKAESELGWKAEKTLEQACQDAWRWQSQNPNGFQT